MRKTTSALLMMAAVLSATAAHAHEGDACGQGDRFEEFSGPLRELAKRRIEWVSALFKRERPTAKVQILGFNDFHGQLTDGRKVSNRPVGSAAVLASYLRDEQTRFTAGETLIVHAGDHVGASPPESALLHDEPSISFLNLLGNRQCTRLVQFNPVCNLVGTLGNHEFDEGVSELKRMIFGGNHADGPFLEPRWTGAKFPYVSANVIDDDTGDTLLRPYVIKEVSGVLVGVIGAVLEATPTIVTPEGVEGVSFIDEADAINKQVQKLKRLGVEAIVVTIHQGGFQTSYTGPTTDADAPTGEIADIVKRLDSAVDVVISGHSHSFTNALMTNASGHPVLVTQAFSSSTAYADIELTIDRITRDVVAKSASIVTTYADVGPGNAPAADVAALVQQAKDRTAPLVNRVVGEASVALTRMQSPAGESALGNLIADSQRAEAGADIALMNPGGIRADLDAGPITWGELFTIQPFGNTLVSMDLTGAQVLRVLEQQWTATSTRFLQISGLRYTWDSTHPIGSRVVSASVNGVAIDPTHTYRVVANNFIAGGGDGFTVLTEATNVIGGAVDLDALIEYVTGLGGPVSTAIEGRITKL